MLEISILIAYSQMSLIMAHAEVSGEARSLNQVRSSVSLDPLQAKKKKFVSGNGSEHFRQGRPTYFFSIIFFLKKIIK